MSNCPIQTEQLSPRVALTALSILSPSDRCKSIRLDKAVIKFAKGISHTEIYLTLSIVQQLDFVELTLIN